LLDECGLIVAWGAKTCIQALRNLYPSWQFKLRIYFVTSKPRSKLQSPDPKN
jgi:hypothetical protein